MLGRTKTLSNSEHFTLHSFLLLPSHLWGHIWAGAFLDGPLPWYLWISPPSFPIWFTPSVPQQKIPDICPVRFIFYTIMAADCFLYLPSVNPSVNGNMEKNPIFHTWWAAEFTPHLKESAETPCTVSLKLFRSGFNDMHVGLFPNELLDALGSACNY